jgi:SGNH hydrolase-like domain, acetyltransferase AlgX
MAESRKLRRPVLATGLLCLASLAVALLLCEFGARLVLNPADYLSASIVDDDVLGIKIAPGTPGFDGWGFRNHIVPSSAEILAIGDSHTYGNNARLAEAWPSVVGRLTGRRVYNLGLGGYGPNQYYHLLVARGLTLKPRWVLCGLYLGDDFENAFLMTYGRASWSPLRRGSWDGVAANIWQAPDHTTWHQHVRTWLSQHSVIYRLTVHGPLLGRLKGALQIRQARTSGDPNTTSLVMPGSRISEAFRPLGIRDRLDQSSPAVREGMRLTLELLTRMDHACREHGCQLVVVLIPTKETVFAEYLLRDPQLPLRQAVAELISNEAEARRRVVEYLEGAGIPFVDTLPALRARIGAEELYTRSDRDMHPGPGGYRVIGEAVAAFLGRRAHREAVHRP